MARVVLRPDVSASPALAHLFHSCHKAACDAVAAEHAAARTSAREVAVVQAIRACLRSSGQPVQLHVRFASLIGLSSRPAYICPRLTISECTVTGNRLRGGNDIIGLSFADLSAGRRWLPHGGCAADMARRTARSGGGRPAPFHSLVRRLWSSQKHRHAPARPPAGGVGLALAVHPRCRQARAPLQVWRLPGRACGAAARRWRAAEFK